MKKYFTSVFVSISSFSLAFACVVDPSNAKYGGAMAYFGSSEQASLVVLWFFLLVIIFYEGGKALKNKSFKNINRNLLIVSSVAFVLVTIVVSSLYSDFRQLREYEAMLRKGFIPKSY